MGVGHGRAHGWERRARGALWARGDAPKAQRGQPLASHEASSGDSVEPQTRSALGGLIPLSLMSPDFSALLLEEGMTAFSRNG